MIVDENSLEEKTGNIARRLMAEDLYKGKIISPAKAIDLIDEDTYLCVDVISQLLVKNFWIRLKR